MSVQKELDTNQKSNWQIEFLTIGIFNSVTKVCQLCLKDKQLVLCFPEGATLNKCSHSHRTYWTSEIGSMYFHLDSENGMLDPDYYINIKPHQMLYRPIICLLWHISIRLRLSTHEIPICFADNLGLCFKPLHYLSEFSRLFDKWVITVVWSNGRNKN